MEDKREHTKGVALLTVGELAFALVALPLYLIFVVPQYAGGGYIGFTPVIAAGVNPFLAILAAIVVCAISVAFVYFVVRALGPEKLIPEVLEQMVNEYSLADMVPVYLAAGFAEEFLFRVVCVDLCGLLIASLLFTAIHIAYWSKPLLLVELFVVALLIGWLYIFTQSLLLCALVHFAYNMLVTWLLKSGRVPMH